jgi:outer membrane lipopolysaccharide assembly protein LptE/RlpB
MRSWKPMRTWPALRRPAVFAFLPAALLSLALLGVGGCGYHALGASANLPPGLKTLSIPVFATRTVANGTNIALTQAVIREFNTRTGFTVTPRADSRADAVLQGTILQEGVRPLTFNTQIQQSSSFLITVVVAVTLKSHDGRVLYSNPKYVFRQQYEATTNLPTFFEEDQAAVQRLSRDFARQLVADVIEGF